MAEATLNDVIGRLRANNEKQLQEQKDTTAAVTTLSGTIRGLLDYLELEALKEKERNAEAKRAAASAKVAGNGSDTGGVFSGLNIPTPLLFIGRTLGSIAAFAAGLTLATEGLGPAARDLNRFFRTIRSVFVFPARTLNNLTGLFGGVTLSEYVTRQLSRLSSFVERRFTFDPTTGRYRNLETGRFGTPGAYQRVLARLNVVLGNIRSIFSSIRLPNSIFRSLENFTEMFSAQGRIGRVFQSLRNNRLVTGLFRFLRPIAAIFSLFDGLRNATDEMEDREGFFNTYLGGGLGGFVSGFFGSFFGEFFNFIKWAAFWPIKQLLPEAWLIENPDGSVSINRDANLFTNILGGLDNIDFNRLITDLIQIPFDALGNAFDFVGGFFTEDGTSREQLSAYWEERGLFGAATDAAGWFANLVFSPINSILRETETAFLDADPERDREAFTERLARYSRRLAEWLNGLVPSMDDIKTRLAETLGPGRITNFLGLDEYLPMDTAAAERLLGSSIDRLQELTDDITTARSQLLTADDVSRSDIEGQLAAAQVELANAQAETQALLARAASSGVNQQIINNVQQQYETFQFPNSGAVDGNDNLRFR